VSQTGIMWQFPHWFVFVLFFTLVLIKYDIDANRGCDVDAIAEFFVFTGNICLMAVNVKMKMMSSMVCRTEETIELALRWLIIFLVIISFWSLLLDQIG
jgi:hypothetical protein